MQEDGGLPRGSSASGDLLMVETVFVYFVFSEPHVALVAPETKAKEDKLDYLCTSQALTCLSAHMDKCRSAHAAWPRTSLEVGL